LLSFFGVFRRFDLLVEQPIPMLPVNSVWRAFTLYWEENWRKLRGVFGETHPAERKALFSRTRPAIHLDVLKAGSAPEVGKARCLA
jgi:hypothetical protein